eukprot:1149592-Pelagomonas_calceolata.AAC.4
MAWWRALRGILAHTLPHRLRVKGQDHQAVAVHCVSFLKVKEKVHQAAAGVSFCRSCSILCDIEGSAFGRSPVAMYSDNSSVPVGLSV